MTGVNHDRPPDGVGASRRRGDAPAAGVWARLRELAERDGEPVSVRHAVLVCVEVLAATGGCLSLSRNGNLHEPVHATDERSHEVEELQTTFGEGPGVDSVAWGSPVLVDDLRTAESAARWPLFAVRAAELGVRSVVALPVRAGEARLGALVCHRDEPGVPGTAALGRALACADAVPALVLDERGGVGPVLDDLLDGSFTIHRARVHQAAGMVAIQLGVDLVHALARLRAHAVADGRPISDTADDVIARRLRLTHHDHGLPLAEGGDGDGAKGTEEGNDR
ncbi:GAF and ANTAR domain-containing protein [Actinosynnema sp. NPDC023587]|uniref:GAF and ANTAR domain-containing protein n=1 Tax=Actinosynnema sp. NPDC023587 TaxID=3154695 RepID=UPI0033F7477F